MALAAPPMTRDDYRKRLNAMFDELERRHGSMDMRADGGPTDPKELAKEVIRFILINRIKRGDLLKKTDFDSVLAIQITASQKKLIDQKTGEEVTALNRLPTPDHPAGEIIINVDRYSTTEMTMRINLVWHEYLGLQNSDRGYEKSSDQKQGGVEAPSSALVYNYWAVFDETMNVTFHRVQRCLRPTFAALAAALIQEHRQKKLPALSEAEMQKYADDLFAAVPHDLKSSNGYQFRVSSRIYRKYETMGELFSAVEAKLQNKKLSLKIDALIAESLVKKYFEVSKELSPMCGWKLGPAQKVGR